MDDEECRDWSTIIAGEGAVGCPTPGCTQNNIHPTAVVVNRGGEITTVTSEGTRIHRGQAEGRGVSIRIRFWCEDGHWSDLKFRFHKGETLTTFDPDPGLAPDEEEVDGIGATIWRD